MTLNAGAPARVTFFMEQHLGHRTYFENLCRSIESDGRIQPNWVHITYTQPSNRVSRLPWLTEHMKGTWIGREQVLRGFSSHPYDVAFFNTQVPAAIAPGAARKKPYILSTDITPKQYDLFAAEYAHRVERFRLLRWYKHRVNTLVFRSAKYVLPWSDWTRASLIKDYGVLPEKAIVIPPGIDLRAWKPKGSDGRRPRRILFVGGDFYRKGGPFLLEVFQALPSGLSELVVVTRSTIPPVEGVTAYQNLSPNAAELIDLYRSCDLFVFPTQAEAFGIAAIEASAAGLPVIANNVGGLPDIVVHGETGFLLERNDLEGYVHAVRFLLERDDLRAEMGLASREHAEAHFDARKNAAKIQDLLVLASRGAQ